MTALVVLPGLDGTGLLLEDFAAAFAPDIRVIVVAYPPDIALDYEELASVARRHLPESEPFVLLGESFSGPLAISLAASAPNGLLGLALCCSFARNPRPGLAWLRPLLPLVPVAVLPTWVLARLLFGRRAAARLRSTLARARSAIAPAVLRARARAALAADTTALLERVRVPVLYLRATEDRIVPAGAAAHIAAHAPQTQIAALAAPHALLQVMPGEGATVLSGFIRSTGARGAPPWPGDRIMGI